MDPLHRWDDGTENGAAMTMTKAEAMGSGGTRHAWGVVAILSFLYFMSFVDRAILALVVSPLMAEFAVSEVEIGLLFGPAFAIFYAALGLPCALIADRGNRRRLVVVGVLLWALCTIASGLAHAFWLLVVLRIGLAIGEAALTPAAYSLIGDMFSPVRRVRAASFYSAVGIAGAAGAYLVGALAIDLVERGALAAFGELETWRAVFFVVGVPAVLGGLLFAAIAREPDRTAVPANPHARANVIDHLAQHRLMYATLFCGAGILQAVTYGYAAWGPEIARRSYGLPIQQAGAIFGMAGLVGAVLGTLIAPALAAMWQARGRRDAIAIVAIAAATVGGAAAALGPLMPTAGLYTLCYALASFGLFGASTGLLVALQVIAPQAHKGTLVAILLMAMTLLGGVLGPPSVALFAPRLGGLAPSLSALSIAATIAGISLLLGARRPLAHYLASKEDQTF
ncbi:MFS transporter [Sphingopyxis kveilinensis]|uniref:MFS transporter n=1 Tax=Sphingopyxis kveilinensis TaxID=3114367 RepID=UPI0030CBCCA0